MDETITANEYTFTETGRRFGWPRQAPRHTAGRLFHVGYRHGCRGREWPGRV